MLNHMDKEEKINRRRKQIDPTKTVEHYSMYKDWRDYVFVAIVCFVNLIISVLFVALICLLIIMPIREFNLLYIVKDAFADVMNLLIKLVRLVF